MILAEHSIILLSEIVTVSCIISCTVLLSVGYIRDPIKGRT